MMPRQRDFALPLKIARHQVGRCPRPRAVEWDCSTTTATAGSTSTACRAVHSLLPPDRKPLYLDGGDRLFRNRGDGTFEDVTANVGISAFPRGYGHGVAVGDVDNDGWPDLFVTRWRRYALYRNRGDGTFEDVTESWGLAGNRDWPTSAAFADFDGDGDLDLYVCHYLEWDSEHPPSCYDKVRRTYGGCSPPDYKALPDHLFRNDGGRFVDVTEAAGIVDTDGRGLGVIAADLDGDGRTDVFVANDQSAKLLFRNRGGLHFEEVGQSNGIAGNANGAYQASMGVACGDVDGDGRPDLAVTNFFNEYTAFYRNLGGASSADHTAVIGLTVPTRYRLGFGVAVPRRQQRRPTRPGDGQRSCRRLPARDPLPDARPAPHRR